MNASSNASPLRSVPAFVFRCIPVAERQFRLFPRPDVPAFVFRSIPANERQLREEDGWNP
jgi:hypothetical protein